MFHVPDENVRLVAQTSTHFYSIKRTNIVDVTEAAETSQGVQVGSHGRAASSSRDLHGSWDGGVKKHKAAKGKPVKEFEVSPECVICMGSESSLVFVPCGHLCTCPTCGNKIEKCCICRVLIDSVIDKAK